MIDILWVLISASLVFLMQPGFMCLESGLTRPKNSINVAVKNLTDFVFSVMAFWTVGYGLMFGLSLGGLFGTDCFFVDSETSAHLAAFFLFQAMFCGTATTIFSGAVAERMRFSAYIIIVLLTSVFIYPLFGHWAWNGLERGISVGWLGARGFVDFAGSTVVHSVGGWVSLAALLVIGPRKGRFKYDGSVVEINAGNLPLSVLGTLLLWFAWFGFNGGSTLHMNESVPAIIVHTVLAGVAGAMSYLLAGFLQSKIAKPSFLINGSLGGLVAITACCHCVTMSGAVAVGLIAGLVCMATDTVLLNYRIDDAVGAIPVHLGCGIWGTLSVALFGDPARIGTGLAFFEQLAIQCVGIASAFCLAFLLTYLVLKQIDRHYPLRVSEEDEELGLNISEHGARTDLLDLLEAMDRQARQADLSIRAPVQPFTETGHIAQRYNQVMGALENAMKGLKASESKYRAFFENTGTANVIVEENEVITLVNSKFEALSGYSKSQLEGRVAISDLFSEREKGRVAEYHRLRRTDRQKAPRSYETELVDRTGAAKPVYVSVSMVPGTKKSLGSIIDLSDLKDAQQGFQKQRAYFHQLFEKSPLAIVLNDADGKIIHVNKGFENLFGYKMDSVRDKYNRNLVVPRDRFGEVVAFNKAILNGQTVHKETMRKHRDGRLIPVSVVGHPVQVNGDTEGVFFIYEDISQRKAFERELYQKAFYDSLTGIANRILFMERLNRAIERTKRRKTYSFAVLLIDLDRFKWVNDSLGHLAGDRLLIQVSQRFKACIRSVDTVGRLGGDEFAVILEEFKSPDDAIDIVMRLQQAAGAPFSIDGHDVHISASIGVVLQTRCYRKSESILRDADIAMYRAKDLGKARYQVFTKEMYEQTLSTLKIETDLRKAVENNQLKLYYQPILSPDSRRLLGFEALIRWFHPERGLIMPGSFIPIAEDSGLIIPVGQWVVQEACRQMATWRKRIPFARELVVSVNISGKQFMQENMEDFIAQSLNSEGLPPKYLKLELTESAIVEDPESAVEQLHRLKKIGVQLLVDDFGTGYSSLAYLHRFPIDYLKIDRSFVTNLDNDKENFEIIKAIMSLAKNLSLSVIAEGIETEDQLAILKSMGCHGVQGFLFSKALNSKGAEALIMKQAVSHEKAPEELASYRKRKAATMAESALSKA